MRKLTLNELKKMIAEEKSNASSGEDVSKRAKQTREIDAEDYADTLEKKIDFMKALKIEQRRLQVRLARINEQINETKKTIKE